MLAFILSPDARLLVILLVALLIACAVYVGVTSRNLTVLVALALAVLVGLLVLALAGALPL